MRTLGGKRYLKVTQRRTKKDWAYFIDELLTIHYPDARKVVLVMDNLNTHTPASWYDTFPPEKAKGLLDRLEIHYTPKHASWLNIAEIELSVLARQGLEHTIATVDELCEQVQSWQAYRNHHMATVRLPVYHCGCAYQAPTLVSHDSRSWSRESSYSMTFLAWWTSSPECGEI